MKNRILLGVLLSSTLLNAQPIFFPDAAFKQALVANTNINTNGDNEIDMIEAASYSGGLGFANIQIYDFTGLQEFQNIIAFDCAGNNVVSQLDVSNNYNILSLSCSDCPSLLSLTTGANFQLNYIDASNCSISTLTLPQNNGITSIDVSNNNLTSVGALNYSQLEYLNVANNPLGNSSVTISPLAPLNLNMSGTNLTSGNFSSLINLTDLTISDCGGLTSLNIANGSNTMLSFEALNNPNLPCIQVDNVSYSTTNWVNVDVNSSFSTNCSDQNNGVGISENDFTFEIFPNPTSGIVNVRSSSEVELIEVYSLVGKKISTFSNTNKINISNLSKGVYLLKVTMADKQTISKKLIQE